MVQRKRAEEGRSDSERIYGRAQVMNKARQRQFRRTRSPADFVLSFVDRHGFTVLRHCNRSGETIGPGTDHHRVVSVRVRHWINVSWSLCVSVLPIFDADASLEYHQNYLLPQSHETSATSFTPSQANPRVCCSCRNLLRRRK